MASFEGWSWVIGGILRFAGFEDFLGDLTNFRDGVSVDPEWKRFLEIWNKEFGDSVVVVDQLLPLAADLAVSGATQHAKACALGRRICKAALSNGGKYRIVVLEAKKDGGHQYRLVETMPNDK